MLRRKPAGQDAFRERRAIVREIGFVPDDGEEAAEALGAQGLRRVEPGKRGPDDHDVTVGLEVGYEIVSKHLVLPRSDGSSRETPRWRPRWARTSIFRDCPS